MPHLPTPCLAPIAGKTRHKPRTDRGEMPRSGEIWDGCQLMESLEGFPCPPAKLRGQPSWEGRRPGPRDGHGVRIGIVVRRVLDITILLLLATVIIMPRPDVKVKPGLPTDPAVRQRVSELQVQLLASPDNSSAALELAGIFMDLRHPDWALASLERPLNARPDDYRLHQVASLALADHFEPGYAFSEAKKALALCDAGSSVPCGEAERGRLVLLQSALERVKHMDMRRDPNSAKAKLIEGLRMTFIPKKRPPKTDGGDKKPAEPPAKASPQP